MNHGVSSALKQERVMTGAAQLRAMKLGDLLHGIVDASVDVEVTDLSLDSRSIVPGAAFLALRGLRTHGAAFASQVVNAGARAILWEPADGVAAPVAPAPVAVVAVPGLSALAGKLANRFFGSPSAAVRIVGVTGTNGKTTTAYVLASAMAALGKAAAYGGTLGFGPVGAIEPGTHTTPDAVTLHREVAALRDAAVDHLALEISSHALELHRVAGLHVDTAVFTNLTHDHLDFHGTLEAYGAAKARLFEWPALQHAVINVDDAFGRELAASYRGAALTVCSRDASVPENFPARAYVLASKVRAGARGLEIEVRTRQHGAATIHSRFVGDFNVDNVLAVLGVLLGWNISLEQAVLAIEQCVAPPGRMETFTAPGRALAIVDYAHTPDALEKALSAARRHCKGKLVCVFGCGGDRDATKRPLMGGIAERLADRIVVTDDNPRTEDGNAIVASILDGMQCPSRAEVQRDRATAIANALRATTAGDVVLVAGKGHEDYQIVGLEKRHFSDAAVVRAALEAHA